MRKEVVVAILSGSLLGLVIAFGVWRANQAFKANVKTNNKTETKIETKKENNEFGLTIASPENYSISTSSEVTFTGITRPNTFVVASNGTEDIIVQADAKGSFTTDISLIGGINPIKITSLDPANGSAEQSLHIIYSSEFKKFMPSESDTKEATDEAETIREKVQEKLEDAQEKPAAYVGTITDLTEKTMQVRDESGEIMQISLSSSVEYTKTTGDSKKIEFKDLAIGDYVAALGFRQSGEVLTGKRIIVTLKPDGLKVSPIFGQITKIDTKKKEVSLKDNKDKEWIAQFGKKWDGPNLTELDEEQKIIVAGTTSAEDTISATRTLYSIEE